MKIDSFVYGKLIAIENLLLGLSIRACDMKVDQIKHFQKRMAEEAKRLKEWDPNKVDDPDALATVIAELIMEGQPVETIYGVMQGAESTYGKISEGLVGYLESREEEEAKG